MLNRFLAAAAGISYVRGSVKPDVCVSGMRQGANAKKAATDVRAQHPLCKAGVWRLFMAVRESLPIQTYVNTHCAIDPYMSYLFFTRQIKVQNGQPANCCAQ
jgi:hypothetical protein